MPVSTNNPVPAPVKYTLLASGSGTFTGNGAVQDLGNFSTSGDLGSKKLLFVMNTETTLGGTKTFGLANAAGGSYSAAGITLVSSATEVTSTLNQYIIKNTNTPTSITTYGMVWNTTTSAIRGQAVTNAFDVSASETFYIVSSAAGVGLNAVYNWQVWIIG